ncbi:kinase-like domain-containing protein [Cantharellus anzutake]|uniref:kinase-like domain-containing protein n=1 Tax=Cantharellus anzutake TaxID=1750568 RepID=UPI00190498D9|nr:kinase-like domain-containing protein [Cantharellus anzutake]KAF8340309.1 kinase-like domain-containing protein [Cantharellus anzutake]
MPTHIPYPRLDNIEDLTKYRPGGYHPVSVGDVFAGRYKVLHKLGFGGSSTVWLARDQKFSNDSGSLVTLKILSAEQSSKPMGIPDLYVSRALDKSSGTLHPGRQHLPVIRDHFSHEGPNGSHLCLISQFAGPSLFAILECPGRMSGSRRLRADLARKVARQVANAVNLLHLAGIVHGDLTPSNILFQVSDTVHQWSNDDVYRNLGGPTLENIVIHNRPLQVVAAIDISRLSTPSLLQEDALLVDFGQSLLTDLPPPNYVPATPLHYLSPNAFFDSKIGFASDVWALACTIFETRAGSSLFDPFLGSDTIILKQIVETLGRFPDPWWSSWQARQPWFDKTGKAKPEEEQRKEGVLLTAVETSLRERLREIGQWDDAPDVDEGDMIEKTGTRLEEAEVELLGDLLEKMLRYNLQDSRTFMTEVLQHPWFVYN